MTDNKKTLLSIIIPVFNEEQTILKLLNKIKSSLIHENYEVIIINDGSNDGTKDLIESNKNLYSKFINLQKNSGKGNAIIKGLEVSEGAYVIFQDADLEYNPENINQFIELSFTNDSDLILGSRFIGNNRSIIFFWHMLGNKLITFFFNFLNNTTFTDIYCCYLFFRRSNLDYNSLQSKGWGQQAEILTYVRSNSKKIFEIAVDYNARNYDEGKKIRYFHVFEVIFWIIYTKIKIIFSK